jgi:hypothetical protein
MLQSFGRSIKIAFVMLKLHKLAYTPADIVNLMCLLAGIGISTVISEPAENKTSLPMTVILYLAIGFLAIFVCSISGKSYLHNLVINDLVYLHDKLGLSLVAFLSGTRKYEDFTKWLRNHKPPREEQIKRINFAAEITRQVCDVIGPGLTRQWFIGANVGLEEISPAEAIRADRFDEVRISATRIMEDQWS